MRSWCSFLLSSRFITYEAADRYIEILFNVIKKEMMVSVRCYIEVRTRDFCYILYPFIKMFSYSIFYHKL